MSDAGLLLDTPLPATPSLAAPLLQVDNLGVQIGRLDGTSRDLARGIRFTLDRGKALCIIGAAGAGKSVIARALAGVNEAGVAVSGRVLLGGVDLTTKMARRSHIPTILQDPLRSLDPHTTVGRQLIRRSNGKHPRATTDVIDMLDGLLAHHVSRWFDRYPNQLTDVACRCIAFASALASTPDVLIADEPFASSDDETRRTMIGILREYQLSRGMATVLFTRDPHIAALLCDHVAVLYAGRIVEQGRTSALLAQPSHPYTEALLHNPAIACVDMQQTGCGFAAHCPHREPRCATERPLLTRAPPPLHRLRACHIDAHAVA